MSRFRVQTRKSDTDGPCRRCGVAIKRGDRIAKSSREFAHPACVSLGVIAKPEAPRYLVGDQTGKACDGCGFTIEPGEKWLTVSTVPWHTECRRRR